MEDEVYKEPVYSIPVSKVMEIVLNEERQKIRKYLYDVYGEVTAKCLDTYPITESEILKLFKV